MYTCARVCAIFLKGWDTGGRAVRNRIETPRQPSVLEVGPTRPIVLRIRNSFGRGSSPTFSTRFSPEIL